MRYFGPKLHRMRSNYVVPLTKTHTVVRLCKSSDLEIMAEIPIQLMKTIQLVGSVAIAIAATLLSAQAQITYTGTGHYDGSGGDAVGIGSVVVNNDANNITFTINANPVSGAIDQYTFYAVDIQVVGQAANGYTTLANPIYLSTTGPALGISSGENAVLNFAQNGYYSNGGDVTGATPFKYSGGSWTEGSLYSYSAGGQGSDTITATVPLSSLGLSAGESFYFDVLSSYTSYGTSGPQAAYSALDSLGGYPAETDSSYTPWTGVNAYDSATDAAGTTFGTAASLYTIAVPEPSTWSLLGAGMLGLIATALRRRK